MRIAASLAFLVAGVLCAGCSQPTATPPKGGSASTAPKQGPAEHDHDHDHGDHDHGKSEGEDKGDEAMEEKDDAHEHAHPKTLAEGIENLEKLFGSVKEHIAAGAKDSADDAVHEIGHVLESLQGLVATSTLAQEGKQAAGKALDELFDCFDSLDQALHAEEGKGDSPQDALGKVAERLEAAFKTIKEAK